LQGDVVIVGDPLPLDAIGGGGLVTIRDNGDGDDA
jgi:hypothetical protein